MSKRAAKEVVQDDKANKRQKRLTYEQRQRVRFFSVMLPQQRSNISALTLVCYVLQVAELEEFLFAGGRASETELHGKAPKQHTVASLIQASVPGL